MEISQIRTQSQPAIKAVLFDAYGTLFDVYSVGVLAEQLFPGHGQALGLMWHLRCRRHVWPKEGRKPLLTQFLPIPTTPRV